MAQEIDLPWSIETWCASQHPPDVSLLSENTQRFLHRLNHRQVTVIHPFCSDQAPRPYELPNVPGQGPLRNQDHLETIYDVLVTVIAMSVPSLLAMGELWLRLFASVIAPLGIAHLWRDWMITNDNENNKQQLEKKKDDKADRRRAWILSVTCLLTVASSVVLLTDTLYVLEFGPQLGMTLLGLSLIVSVRAALRHRLKSALAGKLCLVLLVILLVYDYETGQLHFGGEPAELARFNEGLYYDASFRHTQAIVNHWPEEHRTYANDATPWMPTGDARTGLPFLLNKGVPDPTWTRLWLQVQSDNEVVALDFSFPPLGHDTSKPLYLVLHGLNGGTQEEYVKDFALRRTAEGSTVVVMVARGLMDLPVRGWNLFHGARWTDAHEAAQALRAALTPQQKLAGVGFSMGAIVLANYAARSGADCALDAAVCISGGLDMRYETYFYRAQRLWQPILTQELREKFVIGKWGERVRERLTKEEMKSMLRAYHITEIDKTAIVAYNKFRDLEHYYSEMSALGDIPMDEHSQATTSHGSIHNLSVPLCVIHALDDPLVTWRTVAANEGLLHPGNLTKLGSGNLFLLLTKRGG